MRGDCDEQQKRAAEECGKGGSTGQQRKAKLHSKSVVSKLNCLGTEIHAIRPWLHHCLASYYKPALPRDIKQSYLKTLCRCQAVLSPVLMRI